MRPVNLIPPEDRRGDHAPLRAGVASYAIVAVLAVALIGVVLVILTNNQISENESELAALEARKAQADLTATNLSPYEQFASLEQSRSETVSSLAQSRFDWERVLNELALVIPRKVTLENLTGTVGAGVSVSTDAAAPTADSSITGPSLQITGCADGQKGTARLLAALRDIDGVTRVGMQSSELGDKTTAVATSGESSNDTGTTSCQTRASVAHFQLTVAFDAVPVPATAVPPATATPATATTPAPPATTTTATTTTETTSETTTSDDSGVAATEAEQQGSVDSANQQISDARGGAANVGVGAP